MRRHKRELVRLEKHSFVYLVQTLSLLILGHTEDAKDTRLFCVNLLKLSLILRYFVIFQLGDILLYTLLCL